MLIRRGVVASLQETATLPLGLRKEAEIKRKKRNARNKRDRRKMREREGK
jgi:hypothetical protein